MGANAQTSVPTFTLGQVLTAAQMNESARTGVPVFADSTARDAGFGGTGEKTLAEGQLCYLESTNVVQYYDGSNWATVGPSAESGLVFISSTTIGTTVASVAVTGVFSATYDNYRIIVSGGTASSNLNLTLQMGATTTGYYAGYTRVTYSTAAASLLADNNAANWARAGVSNTNGLSMIVDLNSPFLAKNTFATGTYPNNSTTSSGGTWAGFLNDTTSYTDFTIAVSGTLTGGTIKVYGYKN